MAAWPLTLCLLLCLCSGSLASKSYRHFSSNTEINNVVQDPGTGRVYVGAVNTIYQLDDMLQKQDSRETGPKQDNKLCTPPKFSGCVTKLTNNSNKLLLVNRANGTLVVCGSLFRGICALLSLENVSKVEYYSDSKGEKTYVVSTEDKVSVVGVLTVVQRHGRNASVFLVGKGYGSFDTPKLITTRLLQESEGVDLFESYDESSVWQASAYTNLFRHIFRLAFQHKNFTYFLFSRTNTKNEMGNYTFISRVCQTDTHYYSYMELQLNCSQDGGQQYSKVQAAFVAFPGERLARSMDASGRYGRVTAEDKVLFVVFGTDSQTDRSQASALCMYSLKEINKRLKEIQDACYSGDGNIDGKQAVYTPYSTISNGVWPKNCGQKTPGDRPCGADFLPSPLASTPDFGISAEAVITYEEHLSAVAVAVENEHTIAFLGTDRGWIYKVHLSGLAEQYDKKMVGNTRVNKNLFFDAGQDHIYVTTEKELDLRINVKKKDFISQHPFLSQLDLRINVKKKDFISQHPFLSQLDLRINVKKKDFISQHPFLSQLDLRINVKKKDFISQHPSLSQLDLHINVKKKDFISQHPSLSQLDLHINVKKKDFISQHPSLSQLDLRINVKKKDFISQHPFLSQLDLRINVKKKDFISQHPSLSQLDLRINVKKKDFIFQHPSLSQLDLRINVKKKDFISQHPSLSQLPSSA
ncbi:UNVERIFIED_CONTAM: hypothetical protein FKN15_059765 [Acipenser sinensis]